MTSLPRPSHSPLIAFTLLQNGKPSIYTVRPDGMELASLVTGEEGNCSIQWSPDGQRIAFLSGEICEKTELTIQDLERTRLLILNYETRQTDQVDIAGVNTFTWSPDGNRLAFTTIPEAQGENNYYVYLFSVSDLELSPLVQMWSEKRIVNLDWSPKGGNILAIWQDRSNPMTLLRLFSVANEGEYITLDNRKVLGFNATWDPSGKWLAFTGKKFPEGNYETWVLSADGKEGRVILQGENVISLDWSHEGKLLAYEYSCCDNLSGISVIDLETDAVKQIVPPESRAHAPVWSPDDGFLTFLTETDDVVTKRYTLNVYSFDTGLITQLVKEMVDGGTSWRP